MPLATLDVRSPLTVLMLLVLVAGSVIFVRPDKEQADQQVWTFAATHADALSSPDAAGVTPLAAYAERTGRSVDVMRVEPRPMGLRLHSLLADKGGGGLPDVVQLELRTAVNLLDRPADEVGLLPLDGFIDRDDLRPRLLRQRLEAWQRDGVTYGLPMDVHPVALAYRIDLWQAAGLDPREATSWNELAEMMRVYVRYWAKQGRAERAAMELARSRSDHLTLMLQQQDLGIADSLSSSAAAKTILFTAELVASGLARPASAGHARWARDFAAGDIGMLWMPDWRVAYLELAAPELAGRVGLMPLPRFDPGDAPTASWGGTMLAIPANVPDPEAAWMLAKFIALDPASLAGRQRVTEILPALPEAWKDASGSSDYWDEPPAKLYARLAQLLPSSRPTTRDRTAAGLLSLILSLTIDDLEAGVASEDVERRLQERLTRAELELQRRATFTAAE